MYERVARVVYRASGTVGEWFPAGDWFVFEQQIVDVYAALIGDIDRVHSDPAWALNSEFGGQLSSDLTVSNATLVSEQAGFPVNAEDFSSSL